jgi:hypothetical protein
MLPIKPGLMEPWMRENLPRITRQEKVEGH